MMMGLIIILLILAIIFKRMWPLWVFIAATILAGPIFGVILVIPLWILSKFVTVGRK